MESDLTRKLFLDDLRKPPDKTWDVARTFAEFVTYIRTRGVPEVISFDYELGFDFETMSHDAMAKTGYDCAAWLVETRQIPKQAIIHSIHVVGGARIKGVLLSARCPCELQPYESNLW